MTQIDRRLVVTAGLATLMAGAAGAARHFTPRIYLADTRPPVKLDDMVPMQFGEWRPDPKQAPLVIDPSQLELANKLYQETLNRTYVDNAGHRMMLTIAYGRDQSEGVQLHTPEFCYPASGIPVGPPSRHSISLGFKEQPVVRLVGRRGGGVIEPITYWVTMGDYVVNGGPKARRDTRFRYGFEGFIPDGALFRLSSFGTEPTSEYRAQEAFLKALFAQAPESVRQRLAGSKVFD
ncbi:exosortase-associated protein EpsI, B-type [Aquabacterium sp.]|uniref:exosortase-associated protein EpsI, B-type n=1 Tax=Aquabacterium sp. TaxID=1872578 RepID=UPI0035C74AB7